jgi:hypothetical protein
MNTSDMLTAIQSTPGIEFRAPAVNGHPPIHAWCCYRDATTCHVQMAQVDESSGTTSYDTLTFVPMRDDWAEVML